MDLYDILYWLLYAAVIYSIFQLIRLAFADADLSLLWAARFGKSKKTLKGKVVWVTGASGGIGEFLVYELVRAGCRLVLSARRKDQLERVKRQCLLTGRIGEDDILILPLDVMKFDTHKEALETVLRTFKKIDILVNNAGRSQRALIKDTVLQVDRDMMELNVMGALSLTKTVLPHMLKNEKGHLVFTSSVAGKLGAPLSASYSATKFALQGWCDAARVELASSNIDITTICPGPVFSRVQIDAFTGKPNETYGVDMEQNERRMKTERCADLMTVAIANSLGEVWLSLQPILLITYIAQYMPDTSRKFGKILGRRMYLLKQLRSGGPKFSSSK